MTAFIEKRLEDRLQTAGDTGRIEAIIVVRECPDSPQDDGGLLQGVIARAAARAGEPAPVYRSFPRANAAVLTASRLLLVEILKDEDLAAASTTSYELFPFTSLARDFSDQVVL